MNLDALPAEYRKQVAAQLEEHAVNTQERARVSKYRNQKVLIDGRTFDSKAEAKRYQELKLMEAAGTIRDLKLQPEFQLQAAFKDCDGKRHRAINYRADFQYTDSDGNAIVEDVKGYRTADYKIKAKLFRFLYRHLRLVEIEA